MTTYSRLPLQVAIAAALSSTIATQTHANDETARLETTFVTASRFEQSVTDTIAPISVVTREELDERNVQSVTQAISLLPGVALKSSGGEGQTTSLFIRGTNNKQVLVLVDGQRISSATTGETALNLFPAEQIERIEFVRGPGSVLYGSDAMGGIIQIITRQPTDEGQGQVSFSAGSHKSLGANANWSDALSDTTSYSLSAATERTDGFDVFQDTENDDDGYRNSSFQGKLNHQLSNSTTLKLGTAFWSGELEYDGSGNNESSFDNLSHTAVLSHKTESVETNLSAGYSEDSTVFFGNGTSEADGDSYVTKNTSLGLISKADLNNSFSLTGGVDYSTDDVSDSDTDYDVKDREQLGVFAQVTKTFDTVTTQASVRRSHDSQFDYYNTWSLGGSWQINDDLRLHASHGKAFRAPTYNELYYPGYGNPDLTPETLINSEVSLSGTYGLPWTLSAYYSRATDLISGGSNIDEATLKGFEASTSFSLADIDHTLVAEVNSATRDDNGNDLVFRPKSALKLISSYTALDWSLGTEVLTQSGVYTDSGNTTELAGFAVVNLFASKELANSWTLSSRIDNLFDRDYYTNYDNWNSAAYNSTPFSLTISLSHAF